MSVPFIHPEMLERILPTRDLIDQLGDYYETPRRYETVEPIIEPIAGLNPRAWPPCKSCGGSVNDCDNYDPDTAAPLWNGGDRA